jgi:hypothetical protein
MIEEYVMNRLIRCINCDKIFLRSPFDQWPQYELYSNHPPVSFQTIERDDFEDFLINHSGHRLEDLTIIEDSFVSEKAYSEPIKVSYFKATNGKENFVVKKSREKIEEPSKYQLIEGDYFLKCISIEIESQGIKKQLEREFKGRPFPQAKVAAFLKLYRDIAETIDVKDLERVPEESSIPLEIYYKMDDLSLFYLLRNCRNIFKGREYLDIEEFIQRHKDDGVLLLKGIYEIQIVEALKSKKKAASIPIPLETKKILEKR